MAATVGAHVHRLATGEQHTIRLRSFFLAEYDSYPFDESSTSPISNKWVYVFTQRSQRVTITAEAEVGPIGGLSLVDWAPGHQNQGRDARPTVRRLDRDHLRLRITDDEEAIYFFLSRIQLNASRLEEYLNDAQLLRDRSTRFVPGESKVDGSRGGHRIHLVDHMAIGERLERDYREAADRYDEALDDESWGAKELLYQLTLSVALECSKDGTVGQRLDRRGLERWLQKRQKQRARLRAALDDRADVKYSFMEEDGYAAFRDDYVDLAQCRMIEKHENEMVRKSLLSDKGTSYLKTQVDNETSWYSRYLFREDTFQIAKKLAEVREKWDDVVHLVTEVGVVKTIRAGAMPLASIQVAVAKLIHPSVRITETPDGEVAWSIAGNVDVAAPKKQAGAAPAGVILYPLSPQGDGIPRRHAGAPAPRPEGRLWKDLEGLGMSRTRALGILSALDIISFALAGRALLKAIEDDRSGLDRTKLTIRALGELAQLSSLLKGKIASRTVQKILSVGILLNIVVDGTEMLSALAKGRTGLALGYFMSAYSGVLAYQAIRMAASGLGLATGALGILVAIAGAALVFYFDDGSEASDELETWFETSSWGVRSSGADAREELEALLHVIGVPRIQIRLEGTRYKQIVRVTLVPTIFIEGQTSFDLRLTVNATGIAEGRGPRGEVLDLGPDVNTEFVLETFPMPGPHVETRMMDVRKSPAVCSISDIDGTGEPAGTAIVQSFSREWNVGDIIEREHGPAARTIHPFFRYLTYEYELRCHYSGITLDHDGRPYEGSGREVFFAERGSA